MSHGTPFYDMCVSFTKYSTRLLTRLTIVCSSLSLIFLFLLVDTCCAIQNIRQHFAIYKLFKKREVQESYEAGLLSGTGPPFLGRPNLRTTTDVLYTSDLSHNIGIGEWENQKLLCDAKIRSAGNLSQNPQEVVIATNICILN